MALNEEFVKIGFDIIGAAFEVRNNTGSDFREIYYRDALAWEIANKGYQVEKEVLIPALYKGQVIGDAYRADIVVDRRVIIEVKAIGKMTEEQSRQLITYIRLSNFRLGYLINFGSHSFTTGRLDDRLPYDKGIYRVINNI